MCHAQHRTSCSHFIVVVVPSVLGTRTVPGISGVLVKYSTQSCVPTSDHFNITFSSADFLILLPDSDVMEKYLFLKVVIVILREFTVKSVHLQPGA